MKRVGTYIRITKPELAPTAFERHEERLNQLIAEQCSWIRAKQYREIALHKIDNSRCVLKEIEKEATMGDIDVLLVPSPSMISRNMIDTLAFVRTLNPSGCKVQFGEERNDENGR